MFISFFVLTDLLSKCISSNHEELSNNLQDTENSGFKDGNQYCEIKNTMTKVVTHRKVSVYL